MKRKLVAACDRSSAVVFLWSFIHLSCDNG